MTTRQECEQHSEIAVLETRRVLNIASNSEESNFSSEERETLKEAAEILEENDIKVKKIV